MRAHNRKPTEKAKVALQVLKTYKYVRKKWQEDMSKGSYALAIIKSDPYGHSSHLELILSVVMEL